MLIVAIPKSASTSLLVTLGEKHCRQYRQVNKRTEGQMSTRDQAEPDGYTYLWRQHSDCREFAERHVEQFVRDDWFYKQHIPPTPNNRRQLRDHRIVVLLRDPEEIVDAYHRAIMEYTHSPWPQYRDIPVADIDGFRRRSRKLGLYDDLKKFCDGWLAEWGPTTMVIDYAALIATPLAVVNQIEQFWGLPKSAEIVLARERYTRDKLPEDSKYEDASTIAAKNG